MENETNNQVYYPAQNTPEKKPKKPIYKRWWFWVLIVIVAIIAITNISSAIKKSAKYKSVYSWPSSGMATLLPEPESKNGKISVDSEDLFSLYVYKTSKEQFTAFVNSCKEKGFTEDYSGSDDSYSAEDKNKNELSLSYDEKEKTMSVDLSAPLEETEEQTEEESTTVPQTTEKAQTTTKKSSGSSSAVTPKFKKTMDSYESFFDEYITFMKKYKNSGNAMSMLTDYSNYLAKYQKYMSAMDDINEDELSAADLAYYIEVQARVMKKLAAVSADY